MSLCLSYEVNMLILSVDIHIDLLFEKFSQFNLINVCNFKALFTQSEIKHSWYQKFQNKTEYDEKYSTVFTIDFTVIYS